MSKMRFIASKIQIMLNKLISEKKKKFRLGSMYFLFEADIDECEGRSDRVDELRVIGSKMGRKLI